MRRFTIIATTSCEWSTVYGRINFRGQKQLIDTQIEVLTEQWKNANQSDEARKEYLHENPKLFWMLSKIDEAISFHFENPDFFKGKTIAQIVKSLRGCIDHIVHAIPNTDLIEIEQLSQTFLLPFNSSKSQKTYLMYDTHTRLTKIGKSWDVYRRHRELWVNNPNIQLVAILNWDMEDVLHNRFAKDRVRGEWFDLDRNKVEKIIKIGFLIVAKNGLADYQ